MEEKIVTAEDLQDFAFLLHQEEKSPCTMGKYLRDARAFQTFADGRPLKKDLVVAYKNHLLAAGYAKGSVNSMLASVNRLLVFLDRPDCRVSNVRIQRNAYRPEEKNLSKAEYLRLREAAKNKPRLALILETLFCTGVRISELRYFAVEALRTGSIHVFCKNKTRTILVPRELRKRLLAYAKRNQIAAGPIFCTRSGKPVDRSNVWAEMKRLCGKAKVAESKVFPHNLRRLFARMYYELSRDVAQLADLLGHSSLNTTRLYLMTTESAVRSKLERLSRLIFSPKKKTTTLFA